MTVYLANTTKQHFIHHFRLPERHDVLRVTVYSGGQEELGKQWSPSQTQSFIEDLQRYGARHRDEVSGKMDNFTGLLYSTSKPVTEDQIVEGHEAVMDAAAKRSAEEAKKGALGFERSTRNPRKLRERTAKVTEVEIKQESPRGQKATGDEINFKMTIGDENS